MRTSGVVTALLLVFVGILILGPLLGYPVGLIFVETDSMEDTINVNDGFVGLPAQLVPEIEQGDIIVFQAKQLRGGRMTTHRVVGETDHGYITKGDNNRVTDQAGDEPPVQSEQIIAVAWQPGGEVLVIPHVGTVAATINGGFETVEGHTMILLRPLGLEDVDFNLIVFGTLIATFVFDSLLTKSKNSAGEASSDTEWLFTRRNLIAFFTILMMVGATLGMVGPAGTEDIGIVSSSFESDRPNVMQQGTAETIEFTLANGGVLPMHVYLASSSKQAKVHDQYLYLPPQTEKTMKVTRTAPDETGYFPMFLQNRRYFGILPKSVITPLYEAHPLIPILVINGLFATVMITIGSMLTRRGFDESPASGGPSGDWRVKLLRSLYE